MQEQHDRNEQYDLETSYGSRRHRQRDWVEVIQRELLETARYASVSDVPYPPVDSRDSGVQPPGGSP